MEYPENAPEGFEFTGEFRQPEVNEWFIGDFKSVVNSTNFKPIKVVVAQPNGPRIILKKIIPPFPSTRNSKFCVLKSNSQGKAYVSIENCGEHLNITELKLVREALGKAINYLERYGE